VVGSSVTGGPDRGKVYREIHRGGLGTISGRMGTLVGGL